MIVSAAGSNAIALEFEDNALVRQLCGAHDEHLARIEKALDVTTLLPACAAAWSCTCRANWARARPRWRAES